MKKIYVAATALTGLSLLLTGCRVNESSFVGELLSEDDLGYHTNESSDIVMTLDDYDLQVTFGEGWSECEDTPFDMQCVYEDGESYASVFCYYLIDLAEGKTPADIFDEQNLAVTSKRKNVQTIEEMTERKSGDKAIRTVLFSGEKDGNKNYYYANLVEFGEEADRFAWILFSAIPSMVEKNRAEYDAIVDSMQLNDLND